MLLKTQSTYPTRHELQMSAGWAHLRVGSRRGRLFLEGFRKHVRQVAGPGGVATTRESAGRGGLKTARNFKLHTRPSLDARSPKDLLLVRVGSGRLSEKELLRWSWSRFSRLDGSEDRLTKRRVERSAIHVDDRKKKAHRSSRRGSGRVIVTPG